MGWSPTKATIMSDAVNRDGIDNRIKNIEVPPSQEGLRRDGSDPITLDHIIFLGKQLEGALKGIPSAIDEVNSANILRKVNQFKMMTDAYLIYLLSEKPELFSLLLKNREEIGK